MLLGADDDCELVRLIVRCSQAMDAGEAGGFARCFSMDGCLQTSSGLLVVGREELRSLAQTWGSQRTRATRHSTSDYRFVAENNIVAGGCTIVVSEEPFDSGRAPVLSGHYEDKYIRTGRQWLIQRRVVRVP